MKLIITASVLFFYFCCVAQSLEVPDGSGKFVRNWGIGIICRSDNRYEAEKTNFPNASLPLYNSPDGIKIGTIGRNKSKPHDQYEIIFNSTGHENIVLDRADTIVVEYEGAVLKYYKENNGFINVLISTIPGGGWIQKDDLKRNNFKAQNWLNFLMWNRGEYFHRNNNVDLKSTPNIQGKLITKIRGDLFHIKFTKKTKELWAEVEVDQYDKDPLEEGGKIINKMVGWIQAIDEKGAPRIWFYAGD